jgi:hypothetical protein
MCRETVVIYGNRARLGAIPSGCAGVLPLVGRFDEAFSHRIVVKVVYGFNEGLDAYDVPVITAAFLPELVWFGWLARSQEP